MKRWIWAAALGALAAPLHASNGELHSFHCMEGCPLGAPATNDTVVREIYTLSSNGITKLADWVAYRVTPDSIGPSGGRNWQADPWLGVDETLKPTDYDGASAALHIDRGHQAPLASFSGTAFAAETSILSNITPQASALNQGPWVKLEDQERALAKKENTAVYVYTGPLFERMMKPLPNGPVMHRVPSGYWKVVATPDGRISAFLFDQGTKRKVAYCDQRTSLTNVELHARLVLFPRADTNQFRSLDLALGCADPLPMPAVPSEITGE